MTKVIFTLAALASPLLAQQPAPVPEKAPIVEASAADQDSWEKRHQSTLKFLEASDTHKRLEQSIDKLLTDGKEALLKRNQGLDPRFADEWLKRMRTRVNVDELFNVTVQVYETHFTNDELEELTRDQLALKRGQIYTLSPELAEKLKTNSPIIQRAINMKTSIIGASLGRRVGQEIEKEHPEWGKDTGPPTGISTTLPTKN